MGQPAWNVTVGTLLFISFGLFSWADEIFQKRIFYFPFWKEDVWSPECWESTRRKKKSSCLIIIFNHHIFNLAVHLTLTFSVTLCLSLSREISSLLPRPTRWVGEGRHVWERQWSNPTFASQVPGTSSLEPSGGLWCAACFPFCLCFLLLSMF